MSAVLKVAVDQARDLLADKTRGISPVSGYAARCGEAEYVLGRLVEALTDDSKEQAA